MVLQLSSSDFLLEKSSKYPSRQILLTSTNCTGRLHIDLHQIFSQFTGKAHGELYLPSFPVSSFPARAHQFPGVDFLNVSGRPVSVIKCNVCRRPW